MATATRAVPMTYSRPTHNPWAIALTVTLATFMEVLDTSIANVSLPHIAGGLSASQDEATWVLTSYLVSNAVVLPVSGWISDRIGRKRFYMSCVFLFTVSSFLCGFAPTLPMLIFFRILQGAGGGGLAPSEQAILADTFPPKKRGMAFAVYGMAVVLAPAIGPTLGGFITDNYSWRWIFYINVPVGILSLMLTNIMVEDPPPMAEVRRKSRFIPVDYIGLGLVAVGLGCLQVVLDKGQEDDWFGSHFITAFTITCAVSLIAFIIWESRQRYPIVNLRLFRIRTFAVANVLMFLLGIVLFGTTVLIPLYLQSLMGYTAQKAGEVLSPGAVVIIFLMPLVGWLVAKVDARYLIALGFLTTSLALLHMTNLYLGIDFRTAVMFRVYQAAGLAFLFVPINTISYVGVPPDQNNQVSGLMNLSRNLGGSVGISLVTTLLARRAQLHQNNLVSNTYTSNPSFRNMVDGLTQQLTTRGVIPSEATQQAYGRIYATLGRQASVLAYIDTIKLLAVICLCLVPLVFIMRKNKPGRGPAAAH
ncbi:MAG TPA: DHA2 family efflux MFS transporter permease subunit [Terriglobales bacterium]|nr:DHA2 family efflux MFS transporter permease subunit [Terriglobales bacterium]